MGYLAREDAVMKRKEPTRLVPGAISAIVASLNYDPDLGPPPLPSILMLTSSTLAHAHSLHYPTFTLYTQVYIDPEPFMDPSGAIFARYAQGEDYHDILKPKLLQLQQFIQALPQVIYY
jgi:epoxyqueuosine reductase QueG